jgi:divalent metal cation (Fe/Co/Zn/Cd) transporter
MADPFDITSPTQRRVLVVALGVYVALIVLQLFTDDVLFGAAADLLLAALVVPMGAIVIRRATSGRTTDWAAVATAVAFLVAGLTIGYGGLGRLEPVPYAAAVSNVGSVALLAAFLLYVYQRRTVSRNERR